jgi:DNA primase
VISKETIDEVKNRLDIVDVIGDFITLKRSGQNYKALSPFSNEKTPSFFVVPNKGIFKDFSSGKGGDAITFVMEHESMSYLEAIRFLAKKYGVDLKEETGTPEELASQSERDALYIVMNFAKEHFRDLLLHNDEGKSIGLTYFRERGFNDRTIEKFELGYALNEWDHLTKTAVAKGYREEILEKAGLLIKREEGNKKYDRFRGRVIFPVHNLSGKVIAFGARILTKEKDQPKYINSPETEIYHKSNVLYGLFQGKNAIRKEEFCYLVEGYTDVLSLYQADIENVVASSGTALTEEQIKLMRRFTENVTVLYDGDAAGIKAALRGIDLVLKGGLNVRIVLLPDGEDPDSFSKKMGSTDLKKYLHDHTQDFISFKIGMYSKDSHDPIKKAEAIREIVTSIGLIPDPIKRAVYIQETSNLLKISESTLITELNKILINERKKQTRQNVEQDEQKIDLAEFVHNEENFSVSSDELKEELQELEVVRLLVNYAYNNIEEDIDLISYFITEFEDLRFSNSVYGEIFNKFYEAKEKGESLTINDILAGSSEDVRTTVLKLIVKRYEASPHWGSKYHIYFPKEDEDLKTHAYQNVLRRKWRYIKRLLDENIKKMKDGTLSDKEFDELLNLQMRLTNADTELAKELGVVFK